MFMFCGRSLTRFHTRVPPRPLHSTNRPNAIDPALRRAGRFDAEICIPVRFILFTATCYANHTHNLTRSP